MTNQLSILLNTRYDLTRGGSFVRPRVLPTGEVAQWIVCIPDFWPDAANQMGEKAYRAVQAQKSKAFTYLSTYGHPVPRFDSPVTARFIRVYGKTIKGAWQRAKDTSNLHASTKYLEDALKRPCGREVKRRLSVIVDDSPEWFSPTWEQLKSETGRAYCVVVIEGRLSVGGAA